MCPSAQPPCTMHYLLLVGLFAAPCLALRYMLDSVNEHYTTRGRCILYKIPGHSLVTGKVSAMAPANGRIGAYVRRAILDFEQCHLPFF